MWSVININEVLSSCVTHQNFLGHKRGKSTSILTDVQCGGFVNFEARTPIFGVWPPLTMGINVGLSNWIKFGRSLQKKFALACLGKKVTGKLGQNFLMYKCPVWEPWGIPRCKWGPHPKSRVSSFKIDESPTLDVRENGSGFSPFTYQKKSTKNSANFVYITATQCKTAAILTNFFR